MEFKYRRLLIVLLMGLAIIAAATAFNYYYKIDKPENCRTCHEMRPFVSSYLKPENGSTIAEHKLDCLGCHTNTSPDRARAAVVREIEAAAINKITGIRVETSSSALAVNCTRCHISMKDFQHMDATGNASCQDCHWAHQPPKSTKGIGTLIIPYGPHQNQSCRNCHGTTFEIPRCINCHSGHGDQKLENILCLGCHVDPHVPKKPGILPINTVKFNGTLPFSVCQPCHENEYYDVIYSISIHTDMQTCTRCHEYHGEKPKCNKCHPVMELEQHPDFHCGNCHRGYDPVKITCQDCHGTRVHDISVTEARWNPK